MNAQLARAGAYSYTHNASLPKIFRGRWPYDASPVRRPPLLHSPPKAPLSRMAKDPELTIRGDDGDGLRFDQCGWRKSSPSTVVGTPILELARPMMERIEGA